MDEAHEGFLVDNDEENGEPVASPGALVQSLRRLFEKADRKIFATATPMRKGWKDLLKLCKVLDGEFGEVVEGQPNFFEDRMNDEWFGQLKATWLPTLEKIRNNNHTEKDIEVILKHLQHFVPLSPDNLDTLRGKYHHWAMAVGKMKDLGPGCAETCIRWAKSSMSRSAMIWGRMPATFCFKNLKQRFSMPQF